MSPADAPDAIEDELRARDARAAADLVAFFAGLPRAERTILDALVLADQTFGEDVRRERAVTGVPSGTSGAA